MRSDDSNKKQNEVIRAVLATFFDDSKELAARANALQSILRQEQIQELVTIMQQAKAENISAVALRELAMNLQNIITAVDQEIKIKYNSSDESKQENYSLSIGAMQKIKNQFHEQIAEINRKQFAAQFPQIPKEKPTVSQDTSSINTRRQSVQGYQQSAPRGFATIAKQSAHTKEIMQLFKRFNYLKKHVNHLNDLNRQAGKTLVDPAKLFGVQRVAASINEEIASVKRRIKNEPETAKLLTALQTQLSTLTTPQASKTWQNKQETQDKGPEWKGPKKNR